MTQGDERVVFEKPVRAVGERLSPDLVERTILWLMQQGRAVSERSVREVLGGSPNDLLPLIRSWYEKRAPELLAGRLVVLAKDAVPEPLMALYRQLMEEAGRAAEARLAEREAGLAQQAKAIADREREFKRLEDELGARARTIDGIVPALRAELELARADAAAQASAREAAQRERAEEGEALRSELTNVQAALDAARREGILLAGAKEHAERRADELAETVSGLRADLQAARAEIAISQERSQSQLDALTQAMASQRTAHAREVEEIKGRHGDAAARWADQKLSLEAAIESAGAQLAEAEARCRIVEANAEALQAQLDDERKLRKKDKEKLAATEARTRDLESQLHAMSQKAIAGGDGGAKGEPS